MYLLVMCKSTKYHIIIEQVINEIVIHLLTKTLPNGSQMNKSNKIERKIIYLQFKNHSL